jgi:hypothetical protein
MHRRGESEREREKEKERERERERESKREKVRDQNYSSESLIHKHYRMKYDAHSCKNKYIH